MKRRNRKEKKEKYCMYVSLTVSLTRNFQWRGTTHGGDGLFRIKVKEVILNRILNKNLSRLPFGMNSYIRIFSCISRQKPINSTRFLCCNFAINKISFLNSTEPCDEFVDNLFTAIRRPLGRIP